MASVEGGVTNILQRKRPYETDSSDGETKKLFNIYVLEPADTATDSEGAESFMSIQDKTTASAKDTPDTEWSSESEELEFEVISFDSTVEDYKYPYVDSSSSPDDVSYQPKTQIELSSDKIDERESSSSIVNKRTTIEKIKRIKNKITNCIVCKKEISKEVLSLLYCQSCFVKRKQFLPDRPKLKKKQKKPSTKIETNPTVEESLLPIPSTSTSQSSVEIIDSTLVRSAIDKVSLNEEDINRLCPTCFVMPINGAFVHKSVAHVYGCYQCSVKMLRRTEGRCPVCNVKVSKLVKLLYA